MNTINVRTLNEDDYDNILVGWWKDWGWDAPNKDFLPDNGKCGAMVLDGDEPVCAGFVYITNSGVAWVDWIISNKQYRKKPQRATCLRLLVSVLTNIAIESGSKYSYALIKHKSLIDVYKEFGYVKGDSYTSEMIKIL
jgi:hypothetical protein